MLTSLLVLGQISASQPPVIAPIRIRMDWRTNESFTFHVKQIVFEPELGNQEKSWNEVLRISERMGERIVVELSSDGAERTITCGRRGEIFSSKEPPASWFRLPENSVMPGDEWVSFDDEFRTPFGLCERTNVCVFRGVEMLAGRPIARMVFRSTILGPNVSGGGTGYASVDATFGRLVSLTFHYVLTVNQGGVRRTVPVTLEARRVS